MASGFFALFDDIAYILDDVATMSKVAGKKTASVLGDDLAVNAQKASNFASSRELPVIWAITKGSLLNKIIILPFIFLLSYFMPYLIEPLLMIGGLYLSYEGVEKIYEYLFHKNIDDKKVKKVMSENEKIKSAILTDFILSLEIVIIALSTVEKEPLMVQILVVSFVSFLATIGVYAIVAFIVRMDDMGFKLIETGNGFLEVLGKVLVKALPKVIKALSFIGTLAMLLVAGGIYLHSLEILKDSLDFLPSLMGELFIGLVLGSIVLLIVKIFSSFKE